MKYMFYILCMCALVKVYLKLAARQLKLGQIEVLHIGSKEIVVGVLPCKDTPI